MKEMESAASYIYSSYSDIPILPLEKLLEFGNSLKGGDPIPSFNENLLIELCSDAQQIFEREENVLNIEGDTLIVGDIHGSFHDLLRIIQLIQKEKSKALFLGDYVDRGNFSLECITLLFALKILHPDSIYLIRGNHEVDAICSQYGFKEEILNYHNPKKTKEFLSKNNDKIVYADEIDFDLVESDKAEEDENNPEDNPCDEYFANHIHTNCYKYTEKLYDAFISAFSYLPIGAIVNKTSFCIHGGLSPELERVDNLNTMISRPIHDFEGNPLFTDIVWSDPSNDENGWFGDNQRGRGRFFNGPVVVNFLKNNSLKRVIRAHQCVKCGTSEHFNHKVITVFSASSYSKPMSNYSGVIKLFQKDDSIDFFHFKPLLRLKKTDALYYKVKSLDEKEKQPICFSMNPARVNLNCSSTSSSALKLVPGPLEKNRAFNRKRSCISHFNSIGQGDIILDVWKTPNPKKNSANSHANAKVAPHPLNQFLAKRKTVGFIKSLGSSQASPCNLNTDGLLMNRSSSELNLHHESTNEDEEDQANKVIPEKPKHIPQFRSANYTLPKLKSSF